MFNPQRAKPIAVIGILLALLAFGGHSGEVLAQSGTVKPPEEKTGAYKDGREHGKWTYWYRNGQKAVEGSFNQGRRTGKWIFYYENGKKKQEGTYLDGQEAGAWTSWYEDGTKSLETAFKLGRRSGRYRAWHANGNNAAEGAYKDGRLDGVWTVWNPDGTPLRRGRYKDGVLDGQWQYWYGKQAQKKPGKPNRVEPSVTPFGSPRPGAQTPGRPVPRQSGQPPVLPPPQLR
jgi:antitoxin component YwqK of YwqJK toxin-antitoxin module